MFDYYYTRPSNSKGVSARKPALNYRFLILFSFLSIWIQSAGFANPEPGIDDGSSAIAHSTGHYKKDLPVSSPAEEAPVPDDQDLPDQDEPGEDAQDDTHPFTGDVTYADSFIHAATVTIRIGQLTQLFNNWSTVPLFILHHSWKSFLF